MSHKWSNPGEWIRDKMDSAGEDTLLQMLRAIVPTLGFDDIQDIFESWMDEDGYFKETDE